MYENGKQNTWRQDCHYLVTHCTRVGTCSVAIRVLSCTGIPSALSDSKIFNRHEAALLVSFSSYGGWFSRPRRDPAEGEPGGCPARELVRLA